MSENKPRMSDQIITKMKGDLAEHRVRAEEREKEYQVIYDKVRNGDVVENFTTETCSKVIKGLISLKKKPVNLYLTNWAKLNINDERLFDITGEFKMWKEKREEVEVIQEQLLDVAEIFNNIIKQVIKIREILEQKGKNENGKD